MFTPIYEDPELEVARLAAAPLGSSNHSLSRLPVTIEGYLGDLVVELPTKDERDESFTIIVVPFLRHPDTSEDRKMPFKRHAGHWDCIVVASDHTSYPVGGHRLSISEAELVRGTLRTFELATSPVAV